MHRIDEEDILQLGRTLRQRIVIQQMRAQQFVQPLETVVVLRQTDVQQACTITELDAGNGSDVEVPHRIAHEVRYARGAMDVRERERAHPRLRRFFQQRIGLHHPVLETEPAVGVEVHWGGIDVISVDLPPNKLAYRKTTSTPPTNSPSERGPHPPRWHRCGASTAADPAPSLSPTAARWARSRSGAPG